MIGPLLGGLVISAFGNTWAVAANATSFVVMLIAVSFIVLPPRQVATLGTNFARQLADAAHFLWRSSRSRFALLAIVGLAASAGPFIGLLPITAHTVFHGGAGTTSIFVTAQGVGAILGALLVPRIVESLGRERALLIGFGVLVPGLSAYALAPFPALAAAALVFIGGGYFCVLVSGQAILQLDVPIDLRARSLALFSVALGLPYVAAVTIDGFAADRWGLRSVHLAMAALSAVAVVGLSRLAPKWQSGLRD